MRVDRRPAQAERPQQRSQEPPRAPDPEDPAGSVATGINPSFMIHFTSVPSVGAVDHPSSVGRPLPIPFKKKKDPAGSIPTAPTRPFTILSRVRYIDRIVPNDSKSK